MVHQPALCRTLLLADPPIADYLGGNKHASLECSTLKQKKPMFRMYFSKDLGHSP